MSLLPLLFNFVLKVLAQQSQKKRKQKESKTGKEVKLLLFVNGMILYIENSEDATRKLLELINEFGKIIAYKINTQKSLPFLCTENKRSEKEIKEIIPFTTASKRKKYLGISPPKEAKTYTQKTVRY